MQVDETRVDGSPDSFLIADTTAGQVRKISTN